MSRGSLLLLTAVIIIVIFIVAWWILVKKDETKSAEPRDRRLSTPATLTQLESLTDISTSPTTSTRSTSIQKRAPGDRCLTTAECPDSYFCFNGLVTRKPLTWDETIKTNCNEGMICLDHHLLRLTESGRFGIVAGWWALKDCRDICDSEVEGFVYVLTDEGILWVPTSSIADRPLKISSAMIGDSSILRIFIYRNYLTGLTQAGKLYRAFNLKRGHTVARWQWEEIEFLAGRDLSSEIITDISVSNDGLLSLTLKDNRRLVYLSKWLEDPLGASVRVTYSKYRTTSLHLRNERASLYLYEETLLFTVDRVLDACIDPEISSCLIVLKESGPKRYRLVNHGRDFYPEDVSSLSSFSVIEEPLIGEGKMLLTTSNDVWLVSNTTCIRM